MSANHYDSLGLNRNASAEEIKQAYRKRAKDCHPDATGQNHDSGEFRAAREAYETLSDPAKRREYDARSSRSRRPASKPKPFRTPYRGDEAEIELVLSPEEARRGGEFRIPLGPSGCPFCAFFGGYCPVCGGERGRVSVSIPPGIADGTLFSLGGLGTEVLVEVRIDDRLF